MSQAGRPSITPDSALLALDRRAVLIESKLNPLLNDPRDTDDVPGCGALMDRHDAICMKMADTRATTIEGLRAKARRVVDIYDGPINLDGCDAAAERLAMSIVNDLAAMAAH